jgi:itaconyl-CoA hydratase
MAKRGTEAPKEWVGRFFEDFDVGDVFRSRLGRTIVDTDNVWFTCLTMNTNQVHFNDVFAAKADFGRPLVNSCLTLALITGLSVPDTSENATVNLGWSNVTLPNPVFVGDTLSAESEILSLRPSSSHAGLGIVSMRTRGLNQHGATVIEFIRNFMIRRRALSETVGQFPEATSPWKVG